MNTPLTENAEPLPGYRLIERIGRGGFGEVWKAEAPGGLFKAIKFVFGDLRDIGEDKKAAEQELKALHRVKSIRHPYMLSIERFDIISGQLMIVMELADRNLWDRYQECRLQGLIGIPRDELMGYLFEASEALDLMNVQYQMQHLDIKPQNLFLVHNHVKVADFGLAKDFQGIRGVVTGGVTPVYAAPETSDGWISRFCDQYSLAIVYQELCTGVRPFSGTNVQQLLLQHISAQPNVSSLPRREHSIILRALSKKPDERFASCTEFAKALFDVGTSSSSGFFTRPMSIALTSNAASATPASSDKKSSPADDPWTQDVATPRNRVANPSTDKTAKTPAKQARPTAHGFTTPETLLYGNSADTGRVSKANFVPVEQPGSGVLFPVYVVAIGKVGLSVLRQLHSQVIEKFCLHALPHWKWLFIDTDQETIDACTADPKRRFLSDREVYHARMQRPPYYTKREGLPRVDSWMSNEILYRMPRQPATGGIRCLGRLAFLDHQLAISHRIRQDLEPLLGDDALLRAEQATKLGIRCNRPRVYVASSLTGGTGSGMLIDLAYLIRKEMRDMGFVDPQLTGLLFAPSVDRETPRSLAVANACSTLAELYHWSLDSNRFDAQFDTRKPPVVDFDGPFERCVLLSLSKTGETENPLSATDAATLICQESLTPFGRSMDAERAAYSAKHSPNGVAVQSCAFFRFTWPRQRLLETASRQFASTTLKSWCSSNAEPIRQSVAKWFEEEWLRQKLDRASLTSAFEEPTLAELKASPQSLIDAELNSIATHGKPDPVVFAAAIDRLIQLIGKPGADEETAPGRIARAFETAVAPIAKLSDRKFAEMAFFFLEHSGYGFAAAEEVVRLATERMQQYVNEYDAQSKQLKSELEQDFPKILATLGAMTQSRFLSGASRRLHAMNELLSLLHEWPRKRLAYLTCRCVAAVYRQMLGSAPAQLREVTGCRQQVLELAERIDADAQTQSAPNPSKCQEILPAGCKTVAEAAGKFIAPISPDERFGFENGMQQLIQKRFRNIFSAFAAIKENGEELIALLVDQARTFLDGRLTRNAPTEELLRDQTEAQSVFRDVQRALSACEPDTFGRMPPSGAQSLLIAVTPDEFGERVTKTTQELLPNQKIGIFNCQDEIVFCREIHDLSILDIPQVGAVGLEAIYEVKAKQRITSFSRKDVHWTSFMRE